MLHQSADREPETVAQREIVADAHDRIIERQMIERQTGQMHVRRRLVQVHQVLVTVLVWTAIGIVVVAAAGDSVTVGAHAHTVVPLVRREPGHHPHGQRDQHVGQHDEQPNLHCQWVHEREESRRRYFRHLSQCVSRSQFRFFKMLSPPFFLLPF